MGGGDGPTQLAAVARFSTLEELWLTNFATKLVDDDLIALRDLGVLHMLSLYSADIGDAGLAHVAGLPLTYLNVSGSRVGDAGLAHLAAMTTLRDLDLTSTAVTDAFYMVAVNTPNLCTRACQLGLRYSETNRYCFNQNHQIVSLNICYTGANPVQNLTATPCPEYASVVCL